jgi:hypothetical protein
MTTRTKADESCVLDHATSQATIGKVNRAVGGFLLCIPPSSNLVLFQPVIIEEFGVTSNQAVGLKFS